MAIKKLRFPLEMENGAEVRTIEELRDNFSMEKVLMYFSDGKLIKWLRNNYLDEEAEAISELDPKDPELNRKICDVFGVEYNELENVDIDEVAVNKQRLARLKEYTSEKRYIDVINKVAFIQNELDGLLGAGANEVYLCGESFEIPLNRENVKYIGINKPIAVISSENEVDFKAKNIVLENIRFDEKYLKVVANEKLNADFSGSAEEWNEDKLRCCKQCIELNKNNAGKIKNEYSAKGYIHYSMFLKDFQYDSNYVREEYNGITLKNGEVHRIRNLLSIIADNMKYIKKYTDLSKDKIISLKMERTSTHLYKDNYPLELLKYSGLVLFNFRKEEKAAAPETVGPQSMVQARSTLAYAMSKALEVLSDIDTDFVPETIDEMTSVLSDIDTDFVSETIDKMTSVSSLGSNNDLVQNYYDMISSYCKSAVIGIWVSEKVNKEIVSCGINKELAEMFSYSNIKKLDGYILPFDKIRDILLSDDTVLILEKRNDRMYLFRDNETNNPWLIDYNGNELEENDIIYLKDSKKTDKRYCPECGTEIIYADDRFCRNCGIELEDEGENLFRVENVIKKHN